MRNMKVMGMYLALSAMGGFIQGYASEGLLESRIVQQNAMCKGVVADAGGEPIIGASIVVKGTTNGTVSDYDGYFALGGLKSGNPWDRFTALYCKETRVIRRIKESVKLLVRFDNICIYLSPFLSFN